MSIETIEKTKAKFPHVEFIHDDKFSSTEKHDILNDKIRLWAEGAKLVESSAVLVDVDILFVKSINHFFKPDIVFTYRKNHKFPINLGIILITNAKEQINFLCELKEKTQKLYLYREKESREKFGACDQRAFIELSNEKCHGVNCRDLNEVECNFDERTHAFHYKTGWHPILMDGKPFPTEGARSQCKKAHEYWIEVNKCSCKGS
jgi:hypothetical protein